MVTSGDKKHGTFGLSRSNSYSTTAMSNQLFYQGKIMRVKVYLDAFLSKRLPRRLQFIRTNVNEFCDRLMVQNESQSEMKKKEDIRRSLRARQLWRRAIAFVIVHYLGKTKRAYSDRSFVQMQKILMEEDIVVVAKSRKGLFLLDANTS
jgi:hypothetical protein